MVYQHPDFSGCQREDLKLCHVTLLVIGVAHRHMVDFMLVDEP